MLTSNPPFFKTGTTTACFMGAGHSVDDSEALMIRANKVERASMWCFTSDVGSGSSSHDFVADASAIFSHPRVTQVQTHRNAYSQTTLGMSSAGRGDRLWHSASSFSMKLRWNLVASAGCDSSATSGRGLFTFRPRSESAIL